MQKDLFKYKNTLKSTKTNRDTQDPESSTRLHSLLDV